MTIVSNEEKLNAEEAEIVTEATQPEPTEIPMLDQETVETIVRSIISTPDAVEALVVTLFNNATFKKALATSFLNIYDGFIKIHNNATQDFESVYQVRLLDESEGSEHEFFVRYLAEDKVEFFAIDATGERKVFNETNPGALKATIDALTAKGYVPDADKVYTAVIELRTVDTPVITEADLDAFKNTEAAPEAVVETTPLH